MAPPLNSGPEARDTSVDVLRLRRAAQTDSALTRSASWAAKHMDEEEARLHLEEELSKSGHPVAKMAHSAMGAMGYGASGGGVSGGGSSGGARMRLADRLMSGK